MEASPQSTEPRQPTTPQVTAPPSDRTIAIVAVLLLLIGMPFAWLSDDPSSGDKIAFAVALLIMLAVLYALVAWLLPRERALGTERASRTAMILGIVGFVLCLVFWTGLPIPIGAAALALGLPLRQAVAGGSGNGRATAGVVLGGLAMLIAFVLLLVG